MTLPLEVWLTELCPFLDWTTLAKLSCASKEFCGANFFRTVAILCDWEPHFVRKLEYLRKIGSSTKLTVNISSEHVTPPPLPSNTLVALHWYWIGMFELPALKLLSCPVVSPKRLDPKMDTPVLEELVLQIGLMDTLEFFRNWEVPKTLKRVTILDNTQAQILAQQFQTILLSSSRAGLFNSVKEFTAVWKQKFRNGLLFSVFSPNLRSHLRTCIEPDADDILDLLSQKELIEINAHGHPYWFERLVRLALSYEGNEETKQPLYSISVCLPRQVSQTDRLAAGLTFLAQNQHVTIRSDIWVDLLTKLTSAEFKEIAAVFLSHPSFFAVLFLVHHIEQAEVVSKWSGANIGNDLQKYPAFLEYLDQNNEWLVFVQFFLGKHLRWEVYKTKEYIKYSLEQVLQTPLAKRLVAPELQKRFWDHVADTIDT